MQIVLFQLYFFIVRITMQDERLAEITKRTAERKSERKELPGKNCSRSPIDECRGKVGRYSKMVNPPH